MKYVIDTTSNIFCQLLEIDKTLNIATTRSTVWICDIINIFSLLGHYKYVAHNSFLELLFNNNELQRNKQSFYVFGLLFGVHSLKKTKQTVFFVFSFKIFQLAIRV